MEPLRILVGNEPRAYREVLAAALEELRPTALVTLVDPEALDATARDERPDLVICSLLTAEIRRTALAWILLYPNGEGRGVFGTGDHEQSYGTVDFTMFLTLVDQAAALVIACPLGETV